MEVTTPLAPHRLGDKSHFSYKVGQRQTSDEWSRTLHLLLFCLMKELLQSLAKILFNREPELRLAEDHISLRTVRLKKKFYFFHISTGNPGSSICICLFQESCVKSVIM